MSDFTLDQESFDTMLDSLYRPPVVNKRLQEALKTVVSSTPSLELALEQLLNYRTKTVNIYQLNLCPHQIETFLVNKDFVKDVLKTNGWDVDFECSYKKDTVVITHSGNWYYGQSILSITNA
jgi:hypothetical protein